MDKTIVLNIPLMQNEDRNDYSYLDLIESHLQSRNGHNVSGEESDSRLADLAKSLEKKYGQMVTINKKGKKKRVRVDDFIDHGEGYDSQDSFIDDSEAVELVVAPTMSTKFGGFFINEGFLDSIEDMSMEIEPPSGISKRVELKENTRQILKKDKSKQLLERAVKSLANTTNSIKKNPPPQKNGLHSLDSVFDSVLSYKPDDIPTTKSNESLIQNTKSSHIETPCSITKPAQTHVSNTTITTALPKQMKNNPSILPDLPQKILSAVKSLLEQKPTETNNGKVSLPPHFDKDLLRFDDQLIEARVLKSVRSAVYSHLEEAFGLKRKLLVSKLRKLREEKEESKLEPLLVGLKDAVAKAMPDIMATYSKDMANFQERLVSWETDKTSNSELKRPYAPKKIFKWNNECRSLLERIIAFKMQASPTASAKFVAEDQMKRFFHSLLPLWPDNWISVAALWRAGLPTFRRILMKTSSPIIPLSSAAIGVHPIVPKTYTPLSSHSTPTHEQQTKSGLAGSTSKDSFLAIDRPPIMSLVSNIKQEDTSSKTIYHPNSSETKVNKVIHAPLSVTPIQSPAKCAPVEILSPKSQSIFSNSIPKSLVNSAGTLNISKNKNECILSKYSLQPSTASNTLFIASNPCPNPDTIRPTQYRSQVSSSQTTYSYPPISSFKLPSVSSDKIISSTLQNITKGNPLLVTSCISTIAPSYVSASGRSKSDTPRATVRYTTNQLSVGRPNMYLPRSPYPSRNTLDSSTFVVNHRRSEPYNRPMSQSSSANISSSRSVNPLPNISETSRLINNAPLNSSLNLQDISSILAAYQQRRFSGDNVRQSQQSKTLYASPTPSSNTWSAQQLEAMQNLVANSSTLQQQMQSSHQQNSTSNVSPNKSSPNLAHSQNSSYVHINNQSLLAEHLKNIRQYRPSNETASKQKDGDRKSERGGY